MSSDRSSFCNQIFLSFLILYICNIFIYFLIDGTVQIKFQWAKPGPCFDQDCDVGEKSMPSGNMCMN